MTSTIKSLQRQLQVLVMLIASLLLIGCGGGLFGTGTGDENDVNINTDAVTEPSPTTVGPNTEPEQPGEPIVESTDPVATPDASVAALAQLEFTNLDPGGLDSLPLLKIVNTSATTINAQLDQIAESLFSESIQATSSSTYVEMPTGQSILTLFDADSLSPLVTLDPLNLAFGSVTTLLIRSPVDISENDQLPIDVLPLATRALTTAPGMALVRLIQSDTQGVQASQTATFTLRPAEPNPGSAEVVFSGVNALTNATTDYQLAGPGDYAVNDSLMRFDDQSLSLQPDRVYTLVVTDNPENVIYIEVDDTP